jgi:hypothetical protein
MEIDKSRCRTPCLQNYATDVPWLRPEIAFFATSRALAASRKSEEIQPALPPTARNFTDCVLDPALHYFPQRQHGCQAAPVCWLLHDRLCSFLP